MTTPIKKQRRTKEEIATISRGLFNILYDDHPQTVRGVFYQAVSKGLVDKTEGEYKQTICRLLAQLRRDETIPYTWIADNTRWMRKPRSFDNLDRALEETHKFYRRDLWADQDAYVEIWCEKDAMAGVLYEVTAKWDIPLMVSRGFASITFLFDAAATINSIRKPTYIYYFGDWDPSGVSIGETINRELSRQAVVPFHFERVAILPGQIEEFNLPTRPTKQTDNRAKGFKGESVELDAMPGKLIRELVEQEIIKHIDRDSLAKTKEIEELERQTLEMILEDLPSYKHEWA